MAVTIPGHRLSKPLESKKIHGTFGLSSLWITLAQFLDRFFLIQKEQGLADHSQIALHTIEDPLLIFPVFALKDSPHSPERAAVPTPPDDL